MDYKKMIFYVEIFVSVIFFSLALVICAIIYCNNVLTTGYDVPLVILFGINLCLYMISMIYLDLLKIINKNTDTKNK